MLLAANEIIIAEEGYKKFVTYKNKKNERSLSPFSTWHIALIKTHGNNS